MFTKDGISALHGWTHESLDVLLWHVSSVPDGVLHNPIAGFGFPAIWKQLVHILEAEEAWICDLQDKPWLHWRAQDGLTLQHLVEAKERVRSATQTYLQNLTDTQLNATLTQRPTEWARVRTPAFILHHVVTHTFHHKCQVVAMLRTLGYPAPDSDLQRDETVKA
jgi:uncharacterized damage-inducible protein DinB